MWIKANPNPGGKEVSDCVVRAICIALNQPWLQTYDEICEVGRQDYNMPSDNRVWGRYLYMKGFEPFLLPSNCPSCITVFEFTKYYPYGIYIVGTGDHAVAIMNGDYFDSWDSGNEVLSFFWRIR